MDGPSGNKWAAAQSRGPQTFFFVPGPPTAKELLGPDGTYDYLNDLDAGDNHPEDPLKTQLAYLAPRKQGQDVPGKELMLLGSPVTTKRDINCVLIKWVEKRKSEGPLPEDLEAVGTFFKRLVLEENCQVKASECVWFFRHSLQPSEGGKNWLSASDFLVDAFNEAVEAMGRPRIEFGSAIQDDI